MFTLNVSSVLPAPHPPRSNISGLDFATSLFFLPLDSPRPHILSL